MTPVWKQPASSIAAVAILGLVTLLIATLLIDPVVSFFANAGHRQQIGLERLQKLQRLASRAPDMERDLKKLVDDPVWTRIYKTPSTEAAATALQSEFRELSVRRAIVLDNVQPLPSQREGEFTKLLVRVGFNATIDQLAGLLTSMESSSRMLLLDTLYVSAPLNQASDSNPVLTIRADVASYWLEPAKP